MAFRAMIICSVAKGHTTQGFPKIDNNGETWDVGTLDVASEVDSDYQIYHE